MQLIYLKIARLVILFMLTLILILTTDARSAGMKTVAEDVFYGGAAGALVATGVSLVQDDPDWTKNLRRGTGIGLIVGLGFGVYDGFVLRRPHYNLRALLNVESRRLAWSVPRLVMTPVVFSGAENIGLFDFRFDALRYRF